MTLARLFSMVDHRRAVHQAELGKDQPWPTIPMASPSQQVSEERKPIGDLQPRSAPAIEAVAQLRRRIERALAK